MLENCKKVTPGALGPALLPDGALPLFPFTPPFPPGPTNPALDVVPDELEPKAPNPPFPPFTLIFVDPLEKLDAPPAVAFVASFA